MMKPTPLGLFILLFFLTALPVHAQQQSADHVSARLGSLTPYTGIYIDWSGAGGAFSYDAGLSGGGFITFHGYYSDGTELVWSGQQAFKPSTEAQRLATGVIGTADGEFMVVQNSKANPTGVFYHLEWPTARKVNMTFTGAKTGSYSLVAANYDQQDDDQFLPGTWAATIYNDNVTLSPSSNYQTAVFAVVSIAPAPSGYQFTLDPGAPAGTFVPPTGALLFTISCTGDEIGSSGSLNGMNYACINVFSEWGNPLAIAWFDPVTKEAGIEAVQNSGTSYVLGAKTVSGFPYSSHYDLQITPNSVTGHGVERIVSPRYTGGYAFTGVLLNRLPTGTTRYSLDYSAPPHP